MTQFGKRTSRVMWNCFQLSVLFALGKLLALHLVLQF